MQYFSFLLDENLICVMNDIFAAGSETTANSTAFVVRHLVQNPHIQKRLQDDIDRVVGRDRWVQLSDKPMYGRMSAIFIISDKVARC